MIDKNNLFVIFATLAFFAVNFLSFRSSPLLAAEPPNRIVESGPADQVVLPPPYATRGVAKPSRIVSWPAGRLPVAPAGFEVSLFADELDNPRTIFILPNGDVLIMESLRRDAGLAKEHMS